MNNRIGFHPASFIKDPKPFKQVFGSTKKLLNGVHKQTLAKASWAAEKIILSGFHQLVNHLSFINLNKAPLSDFPEILKAYGGIYVT